MVRLLRMASLLLLIIFFLTALRGSHPKENSYCRDVDVSGVLGVTSSIQIIACY
jgi:hypothetical protein